MIRLKKGAFIYVSALIIISASGCANYQAVGDFSTGTEEFVSSYDSVFTGSYETCLSTAEIKNIILDLDETPKQSPLAQYGGDKRRCAPYKSEVEAFNETTLALRDFSAALGLVVKRSEFGGAFENLQFVPQFSGIDENIVETVPELSAHKKQIIAVNDWKSYFGSFFVQKTPQEVILENQPRLDATFALLGVYADIYQVQLDNYERNIKLLDTLLHDTGTRDVVKRTFVINRSKERDGRQALLNNYNETLGAVRESYHKLYQRSELPNPHYGDPVFQAEMKEFMIRVASLVQQAKLI